MRETWNCWFDRRKLTSAKALGTRPPRCAGYSRDRQRCTAGPQRGLHRLACSDRVPAHAKRELASSSCTT